MDIRSRRCGTVCKLPDPALLWETCLQTEYAVLMAEKKAAYAEYRKARADMKELLTAKANIDRILELEELREEPNGTKEKEAEQR